MMEAKYKVGQELQTNEGDRHIVEEIRHRYVVRRTHAVPVKGVRLTVGAINEYREEDLAPYARPLQVGEPVRLPCYHRVCEIVAIAGAYAWVKSRGDSSGGGIVTPLADLIRIPEEAA